MPAHLDLVLIADTHELHREVEVPPGDCLIHAGDFSMSCSNASAIADFNHWLGELPHPVKLVIPGNHEFFLEADHRLRSLISNATILINEGVEIAGLRIWGSPVTALYSGAFGLSSEQDRHQHWANVPNVDVLVTHGPPYGILDGSGPHHSGDPELLKAVERVSPLLHAFGHIHHGYGQVTVGDTLYVNCALLGAHGAIENKPVVLRIPKEVRPNRIRGKQ